MFICWRKMEPPPRNSGWFYVRDHKKKEYNTVCYYDGNGNWFTPGTAQREMAPNNSFNQWLDIRGVTNKQGTASKD